MKTKISTKWHRLLLGAIPALLLGSCITDKDLGSDLRTGDQTMVTFSIQLPAASAPASRAMTGEDENAIGSIRVLAFKDGFYSYQASGTSILPNGGVDKKKFTVVLRKGDYDLVIVANAPAALDWNALAGQTKADAMDMLEATMPNTGKWGVTDNIQPIPMWGNVGARNIGTDNIPEIPLLRMVARVNVTLTEAESEFKLTSVHLYNYNNKGRLAPTEADWGVSPVTAPNLPDSPGRIEGPVDFAATTPDVSCINEIYMFEAAAGSKTALPTNPCIVVGGTYDGSPAFYRVDFATDADHYLAILRNHSYNINITGVKNAGHPTADDAFRAGPENITVEIIEWDNGGMGDVIFDGQNLLSIRPGSEMEFYKDPETQTVEIKTDVAAGWQITKITSLGADGTTETDIPSGGWLSTNTTTGASGSYLPLNVSVTDTDSPRTGYIYIKAGRLEARVTVNQSSASALGIQLTDGSNKPVTELVFANKATISPQILKVNWQPKDANLTMTHTPVGTVAFTDEEINNIINITGSTGFKQYTITPTAFSSDADDPFQEKVSKIDFTTTDGIGYASASVFLRQVNYAAIPVGVPGSCLLDGGTYSFKIRCNTAWEIDKITDSGNFLDLQSKDNLEEHRTGGYNINDGDEIRFTVINDINKTLSGKIEVKFISPDGLFDAFTVTIEIVNLIWARSNIVWVPGSSEPSKGKLTFAVTPDDNEDIPASSQGVFFKWGSLVAISPPALDGSTAAGYTKGYYYDIPQGHILFSPTDIYDYTWYEIPYFKPEDFAREPWNNAIRDEDDFKNYDGNSNNSGHGYDEFGRGDICRYISDQDDWVEGNWRLPTGVEIDALVAKHVLWNNDPWYFVNNTGVVIAENDNAYYGFFQLVSGRYFGTDVSQNNSANPTNGVSVPASGYRATNGTAECAGNHGSFWSGTSGGGGSGHLYMQSGPYLLNSDRQFALPVRCVRTEK